MNNSHAILALLMALACALLPSPAGDLPENALAVDIRLDAPVYQLEYECCLDGKPVQSGGVCCADGRSMLDSCFLTFLPEDFPEDTDPARLTLLLSVCPDPEGSAFYPAGELRFSGPFAGCRRATIAKRGGIYALGTE